MRFFEYEARKIVELAGIPVTKYGFCTSAERAREVAEEIGGTVVIKSQVLSGGRMKAGGVKFPRPRGGRRARRGDPKLEINGQCRAASSSTKAEFKQEYYAGSSGTATRTAADAFSAWRLESRRSPRRIRHVGRGHVPC